MNTTQNIINNFRLIFKILLKVSHYVTIVYCYLQAGQFLPLRGKEEQEPFTGTFVIIIIIISYYSLFKNRRPLPAPFLAVQDSSIGDIVTD